MKKILVFFVAFTSILVVGCNNENEVIEDGGETASLSIRIASEPSSGTRLVGDATTNSALEGVVSNLTIFVFNYNSGVLEKTQGFTVSGSSDYIKTVTGLSTGTQKRIVAFVNVPTDLDISGISSYSDLNSNMITLDSQNSASDLSTVGLFMSGEYGSAVTLSAATPTSISIDVKRRVAKVILQSLVVDPETLAHLDLFALGGVSIQKARLTGTPVGLIVQPGGDATLNYAGGFASPAGASPAFNITRNYLAEAITEDFSSYTPGANIIGTTAEQRYFYVLPNDNTDLNATIFTVYGTYNSSNVYYPFIINSSSPTAVLTSNVRYLLSITLRKINVPSEDPNVVPEDVSLEITLVPQDWDGPISQSVEW